MLGLLLRLHLRRFGGLLNEYRRTSINQWMLIYVSMLVSVFPTIVCSQC
jgi:hypothetical protein